MGYLWNILLSGAKKTPYWWQAAIGLTGWPKAVFHGRIPQPGSWGKVMGWMQGMLFAMAQADRGGS
jgi:hypothetical protein